MYVYVALIIKCYLINLPVIFPIYFENDPINIS